MTGKRKKKRSATASMSSSTLSAGHSASGSRASTRRQTGVSETKSHSCGRVDVVILLTLFLCYGYFHQGGGWNQNARFDQVRAIVEAGGLSINRHLVYHPLPQPGSAQRLQDAVVPPGVNPNNITDVGNSGDVSQYQGLFYPNKPPGTVFVAVPAYFVIHMVHRHFGSDLTKWATLTVSLYLTVAFSIGLAGALAGVGYHRLARELFPQASAWAHVAATFTFGLGTMMFPFSTLFFDHVLVAGLLLWSLLAIVWAQKASAGSAGAMPAKARSAGWLLLAGLLIGFGIMCNYLVAGCAILYSAYALRVLRPRGSVLWLWSGILLPVALLAWYHQACFGSVLATANTNQASLFESGNLLFGTFGVPQIEILGKILFSQYRGLFFTSPVLLLAALAWVRMAWRKQIPPELVLCGAAFVFFLAINSAFQGEGWSPWSGGWSFGPRYLIPGMALLAMALVPAFDWLPRTTGAWAIGSMSMMLFGTAVDPQPPMGFPRPLTEYLLPLATSRQVLVANNPVSGPVSANPIGVYEAWYYRVFPPGSFESRWNSFNLGEVIFPESLLSLAPLIVLLAGGVWWGWRGARSCAT